MKLGFSRWLAILFGFVILLMAAVRNWTVQQHDPAGFFADFTSAAFLLFGAWKVSENEHSGKRYLAAAWGLTCGLFYASLVNQMNVLGTPQLIEPVIGPEWIALGTSFGLLIAIAGLITSLGSSRSK
jgi:hypothetical protein